MNKFFLVLLLLLFVFFTKGGDIYIGGSAGTGSMLAKVYPSYNKHIEAKPSLAAPLSVLFQYGFNNNLFISTGIQGIIKQYRVQYTDIFPGDLFLSSISGSAPEKFQSNIWAFPLTLKYRFLLSGKGQIYMTTSLGAAIDFHEKFKQGRQWNTYISSGDTIETTFDHYFRGGGMVSTFLSIGIEKNITPGAIINFSLLFRKSNGLIIGIYKQYNNLSYELSYEPGEDPPVKPDVVNRYVSNGSFVAFNVSFWIKLG